jgi:hypothetical protein
MESRIVTCLPVAMSAVLLVTAPAFAANEAPETEAKAKSARTACLAGDPDRGAALLAELFVETRDFNHIYNQGRCFEQNRLYEEAIGRFREYLVKGDRLTQKEKADAESHIARCQSYLPKREPAKPAVVIAPEPVVPVEQAQPVPPPADQATPAVVVAQPKTRPSSGREGAGTRLAGIVVGAVGVAGITTGVILNLKVNQMSSDLEKPDNYSRKTDSSRKTYTTAGWISYGLGAACLATGSLLYYLGWRSAAGSATAVAWIPTASPDMAGIALEGSF